MILENIEKRKRKDTLLVQEWQVSTFIYKAESDCGCTQVKFNPQPFDARSMILSL